MVLLVTLDKSTPGEGASVRGPLRSLRPISVAKPEQAAPWGRHRAEADQTRRAGHSCSPLRAEDVEGRRARGPVSLLWGVRVPRVGRRSPDHRQVEAEEPGPRAVAQRDGCADLAHDRTVGVTWDVEKLGERSVIGTIAIIIESRFGADGVRDLDTHIERAGIELAGVDLEQANVARRRSAALGRVATQLGSTTVTASHTRSPRCAPNLCSTRVTISRGPTLSRRRPRPTPDPARQGHGLGGAPRRLQVPRMKGCCRLPRVADRVELGPFACPTRGLHSTPSNRPESRRCVASVDKRRQRHDGGHLRSSHRTSRKCRRLAGPCLVNAQNQRAVNVSTHDGRGSSVLQQ